MCKVGELHALLLDIKKVAVGVQVVQPVGIDGAELLEVRHRLVHLPHVVKCYCHLRGMIEGQNQNFDPWIPVP